LTRIHAAVRISAVEMPVQYQIATEDRPKTHVDDEAAGHIDGHQLRQRPGEYIPAHIGQEEGLEVILALQVRDGTK
jgi:hypothetical protein